MPIFCPGNNSRKGFTVLDSLITVVILSLVFSALFSVLSNLQHSSDNQFLAMNILFAAISERESSSWEYKVYRVYKIQKIKEGENETE